MTSLSERDMNRKRNWKAQTFNFDYYIPDESGECEYCLTYKQAELIRGIIEPLAWETRWFSPTDASINQTDIEQFRNELIRRLQMACCDNPPIQFRFDPETGAYQKSTDGGATWENAPEYDPRENSTVNPPPSHFGISTTKCQNADSMVKYIQQEMINSIAADAAISAILGVVGTAILTLATGGTFLFFSGLLDAIVSGIFAFGIVAWQAAFTTTVLDDFRCAIFDNMDSDDSMGDAGITALLAFINSHYTGIVVPTLYGYVNAMGRVGCTNAIRSNRGDPDADCTACEGCSPDSVRTGLYYSGVWHDMRGGNISSVGSDYVIVDSQDRGDGQQEICINSIDLTTLCNISIEWVGSTPGSVLQFFNYTAPVDFAALTHNDLQTSPFVCCSFYLQIDPGSWQLKVTFLPM